MNKWNEIWSKKETRFDKLDANDYKSVLVEMKRLAGWDHFGKGSSVCYEDFAKEHEYMKKSYVSWGGTAFLRLDAVQARISTCLCARESRWGGWIMRHSLWRQ